MPAFDPSCIDVSDFLECLEIRNVRRATEKEFNFSCPYPVHDLGDETPSAYMNANTTAFMCHSCHARGNAVSFTADILGVSPLEAIRMLKGRYSPAGLDPDARDMIAEIRKVLAQRVKPEHRENRIVDPSILAHYWVDWHALEFKHDAPEWAVYMFERGFSASTLAEWQFGYSVQQDRITLPIHNEHGQLVGIKARAWNMRKPKYLNLRDKTNRIEPYLKNDIVFALHRAKLDGTHLIVVEGEFNAIAMHAMGYRNTVAINGSYYGERQIKLLKMFANSVTLFFDTDSAGKDATKALTNELNPYMPVYISPDHDGDPAEMARETVRACLAGSLSAVQWRLVEMRQSC